MEDDGPPCEPSRYLCWLHLLWSYLIWVAYSTSSIVVDSPQGVHMEASLEPIFGYSTHAAHLPLLYALALEKILVYHGHDLQLSLGGPCRTPH